MDSTALRLRFYWMVTQGSAFRATLGFGSESLWDSLPCLCPVILHASHKAKILSMRCARSRAVSRFDAWSLGCSEIAQPE